MPPTRPRLRFSLRTLFVLVTVAALSTPAIPPLWKWLFPPEPPAAPSSPSSNLILTYGGQSVFDGEVFVCRATIRYTGAGDPDPALDEIAKKLCADEWYIADSDLDQQPNQTRDDAQAKYVWAQFLREVDDSVAHKKFDPADWSIKIEPEENGPLGETQTGTGFF